jgi:transmembrane sensor
MKTEPHETREQVEEIAATWIARRGGAAWTGADAAALQAWLDESVGHRVAYYRLNEAWTRLGDVDRPAGTVVTGAHRPRLLAIAASVLLVLAASLLASKSGLFDFTGSTPVQPVAAETPAGSLHDAVAATSNDGPGDPGIFLRAGPYHERFTTAVGAARTVTLPDGSRMMLDTDTEIRVSMDGRSRTVDLARGQGFFKVAHDPAHPFIVTAGRLRVVAVGTEFSVRRESANVRVDVAEGVTRLEGTSRNDTPAVAAAPAAAGDVLLHSGGIAHVDGDAMHIEEGQATEVERNLSWRSGMLTFRKTALADAVAEFNRYSTRKIVITDAAIASLELGGVFRSSDAEAFVRLLERTFPIDAAVRTDRIELTARRSP